MDISFENCGGSHGWYPWISPSFSQGNIQWCDEFRPITCPKKYLMDHKKGYFINLCHRGHSDMLITALKGYFGISAVTCEVTWTQFAHTEHDWDKDVEINYYFTKWIKIPFINWQLLQNIFESYLYLIRKYICIIPLVSLYLTYFRFVSQNRITQDFRHNKVK